MRQVIELYQACGGGSDGGPVPARVLQADPPSAVWEGLLHYCRAHSRIRSEDLRERDEERNAKRQHMQAQRQRR